MNVLIFVMTMLMLLSLMTYSRLETYRSSQVFQIFFNQHMESDERSFTNKSAEALYDHVTAKNKEEKDTQKDTQPEKPKKASTTSNRRISLSVILDKKSRESSPKEFEQRKILLKNLINTLYAEQPFFKAASEKHSNIADELIDYLIKAADDLPQNKKLKKTEDLANLRLPDEEFDLLLYRMLHGAPYKHIKAESTQHEPSNLLSGKNNMPEIDSGQIEAQLKTEADEPHSKKGYASLLDFITLKTAAKIRIFLAPRQTLKAIYSPQTVDEIIKERKALYNQALSGTDPADLEKTFKSHFDQHRHPEIDSDSLDYTITKTNPKNYEY